MKIKKSKTPTQKKENIFYSILGPINHIILAEIISIIELKHNSFSNKTSSMEKLLNTTIEIVQNMINYDHEIEENLQNSINYPPLFIIGVENDLNTFYVSTKNKVDKETMLKITERLEYLNSLDSQKLKLFTKELKTSGEFKHSKGAGIGFAQMRRYSSQPIIYDFEQISSKNYYFYIKVIIAKKGN